MHERFKEGDLVKAVVFPDGGELEAGKTCDMIVVVMENGQMAGVPWFEVIKDGKVHSKWNGALVMGVLSMP